MLSPSERSSNMQGNRLLHRAPVQYYPHHHQPQQQQQQQFLGGVSPAAARLAPPHHLQSSPQRHAATTPSGAPGLTSPAGGGGGATSSWESAAVHECAGCRCVISERYLLRALDRYWHEDCLKCSCCDCRLGEVGSTLFTKANLLLCRRDYLRLFGATGYCSACTKMIPAFEMVMKAKGNVYHLECFACQQCNHRFCIGDRYYLCDNKILCQADYEERLLFARMSQGYSAAAAAGATAAVAAGSAAATSATAVAGCAGALAAKVSSAALPLTGC